MDAVANTWEIYRREFKAFFESPMAYVFLVVFLLLTGFFTFQFGQYYERGVADLSQDFGFFFWHPWVYLLLVPAVAMRTWAEERRSGTIELLLTLPISTGQAMLGKFLAAWSFLGIALLLTCPIVFTTSYLGDPDLGVVLGGYCGSLLLAGAYLAVGMLASATTRNQVISFVVALVLCLVLLMAGWAPVTNMLVRWAPNWLVEGVAAFSFMPHYLSLQRGVLDARALVYYASVMGVVLFATHVVLQNKKAA